MTLVQRDAALAAIWEIIIEDAEWLHNAVVLSQSRPSHRTATRLLSTAEEIAALARAAIALSKARRKTN